MPVITTANLKTHLGISDSVDDTTLGYAVNSTNKAIVNYCGRNFDKVAEASETARSFPADNSGLCRVDDFWSTLNLVVKTDDNGDGTFETTWTIGTDLILEPLNGLVNGQAWPYCRIVGTGTRSFPCLVSRPGVQVTAAWGWTATPDDVFEAALIKAARTFKRKSSPEGVLGGLAGSESVRISRFEDPDVVDLLAPYVKHLGYF